MVDGKNAPEVIVSYETVFDMVRREKNRSELQPLAENFVQDVCDYLQAKKTLLHKGFDADTPVEEKQKLIIHIQNMKKLLRDLYDRRESKILQLAQNKVRTGNILVDEDVMLPEELELFKALTEQLASTRTGLLTKMTQAAADRQLYDVAYQGENQSTLDSAPIPSVPAPSEPLEPAMEEKPRMCTLRFLQPVPKFVGRDLEVYGPYAEQDVASLPPELAEILVSKGRAEELQVQI